MSRGYCALLAALILGTRLAYVFLSDEGRNPPIADASTYVEMAANLAQGEGLRYQRSYSIRPPGYPLFLAGLFKLTGNSLPAAQVLQVLFALLSAVLLYKIARFYYDEGVARLAVFIYAVSYDAYVIPATFLSENLYVFLLLLSVHLLVQERIWAAALALSALCFTRQESIVLILFLALVYAYLGLKRNAAKIAAILSVFLVFETAWVLRNWRIHHAFVGGTTLSEAHSYLSNAYIFQRLGDEGGRDEMILLDPEPGKTELEMAARNKETASALFSRQPLHRILLAPFLKIGFFLYPFLPQYDASFMFILPFWLWGLYREKDDWKKKYPLYGVFAIGAALLILFHAQPRYRGPFYPFIALFAAVTLLRSWSKGLRSRFAIAAWGMTNALIWVYEVPARAFVKGLLP